MQNRSKSGPLPRLLISLSIFGLVAAAAFLLVGPTSEAVTANGKKGLIVRTESHEAELPNYDIRDDVKNEEVADALAKYRLDAGKDAAMVADVRDEFVRGESEFKTRFPSAKVEYNSDIRTPEVLTPDVFKNKVEWLSSPSSAKRSEILRSFVKEYSSLIGVSDAQADDLKVAADYSNPSGNMSFAHLEQLINGVPVFRGEVKAGFTKDGQIIRVINNLAAGLDYGSLSAEFGDPVNAVRSAARHINYEVQTTDVTRNDAASTDLKVVFGTGDSATTAEKMYFPTEPGVAVPAWRVLIWQPVNAYYVIVDAENGRMLWRKNIGEDQTTAATYQVYNNANSYLGAADSPAPLSPGPIDPTSGTQGPIGTRTNVTLIGNEGPLSFNNNGWMTDGTNITDGNAVEAGVDRVTPDGVDAPQPGDGTCPGAGCREFTSLWNPPPGNPTPGDEPLTPVAQRGAVIQMFYVMNRYHDVMYQLGFTEQARNFQNDNFGRGGVGADRVRAEGQDSSGTNNANMNTPADGGRGRMQMYMWTGPTPDYDGTADAEVIIHEITHGTSNRLHGNASGLSTNMARGMGEGWSDFYAYTLLAEPTDPINGIYTTGGYATYLAAAGFTGNYYYGIRRFPRAPITFLGPNGKPHAPFTFRHINAGCATEIGTTTTIGTISAFPRGPFGVSQCDAVHNAGEIWSSALWEVRNRMVTRLGFQAGTNRVLQVVTDGMKLAPLGPTFLQERDAIIAAAAVFGSADVFDVREGFRVRGMGFSSSIQSASPAAVTEAFDVPNAIITNPVTVSDSSGDNDGFPEPGESLLVSVPVTNNSGSGAINNVMISITGGGTVNYGNIADGATVTNSVPYTVPADAPCGSDHMITITGSSALGALNPKTHTFRLGVPVGGPPVVVNGGAISVPGTGTVGVGNPYPSTVNVAGLSGTKKIVLELTGLNTTFPGDMDWLLVGPGGQKYIFMSDAVASFATQTNANVVIKDDAAATMPATGASVNLNGEWKPTNHGANDAFAAPAPAGPYENAAPGGSATFASVFGTNGANLNGTWSLYGVDDVSGDVATITGWKLTFESDQYACNPVTVISKARADFDNDGKSDLSVFRPSEGNWYLNQTTAGFGAINWGISTDTLVPGDYDADGKTDTAIYRPTVAAGVPDFMVLNSNGFTITGIEWGIPGDLAMVRDYDADGKADAAVFRPSTGTWYVHKSTGGIAVDAFGQNGDIPVAGDYDGDGKANYAIYRPGDNSWYIARATGIPAQNFYVVPFGTTGDKLVPADYDGDAKEDVAVYRPSQGRWYILRSTNGSVNIIPWGISTDVPVPGDYDGDGSYDVAVYRSGTWYINRTTSGIFIAGFGLGSDTAIPAEYLP